MVAVRLGAPALHDLRNGSSSARRPWRERGVLELNTFSIVARCPRTGELGVAVATAVPAVGALCPFVSAGVGAAATQSWVNPYLAIDALEQVANGIGAADALERVLASDPCPDLRQIGLVD